MAASVLYMSMSLDGYIAGPNDDLGRGLGDGGDRLHVWAVTPDGELVRPAGPAGQVIDEMNATGAVLVGRRTAEFVDHWGGDHHGRGVPIFVPGHRPPGPAAATYPLVTYAPDGIASAMAQAKAAAGDRNVEPFCNDATRRLRSRLGRSSFVGCVLAGEFGVRSADSQRATDDFPWPSKSERSTELNRGCIPR